MPEIIARAAWDTTGDPLFTRRLDPTRVRGLVLHYPGDGPTARAGLRSRIKT